MTGPRISKTLSPLDEEQLRVLASIARRHDERDRRALADQVIRATDRRTLPETGSDAGEIEALHAAVVRGGMGFLQAPA